MAIIEQEIGKWINENIQPIFDVRSPAEFNCGHISGAKNFPLFDDEERRIVGITYKQKGSDEAMRLGLQLVGPKLAYFVEQAIKICPTKQIRLHCWRGGKRSSSMAWLLSNAGFQIGLLVGGYKAYRQFQTEFYTHTQLKIIKLSGRTGTAKTVLLEALAKHGEQIVNLESLAHHKGSAFGWIGEQDQDTNEQFANNLFCRILQLDLKKWIWFENESRTIGHNHIPDTLWKQIKQASLINIERNIDFRLDHLVNLYQKEDDQVLKMSFEKLRKKLGHEKTQKAIDFVTKHQYAAAVEIALSYYDKCYDYNLAINSSPNIIRINFESKPNNQVIEELFQLKKNNFGE